MFLSSAAVSDCISILLMNANVSTKKDFVLCLGDIHQKMVTDMLQRRFGMKKHVNFSLIGGIIMGILSVAMFVIGCVGCSVG